MVQYSTPVKKCNKRAAKEISGQRVNQTSHATLSFRAEGSAGMKQAVRGDSEKESRNLLPGWRSAVWQAISGLKSFKTPKHPSSIPQLRWR
jgi:hypothetical protein